LGYFAELEVVLQPHQSIEDGQTIAHTLLRTLQLEEKDLVQGAYADLLALQTTQLEAKNQTAAPSKCEEAQTSETLNRSTERAASFIHVEGSSGVCSSISDWKKDPWRVLCQALSHFQKTKLFFLNTDLCEDQCAGVPIPIHIADCNYFVKDLHRVIVEFRRGDRVIKGRSRRVFKKLQLLICELKPPELEIYTTVKEYQRSVTHNIQLQVYEFHWLIIKNKP